jgi:hypothetical protein
MGSVPPCRRRRGDFAVSGNRDIFRGDEPDRAGVRVTVISVAFDVSIAVLS